MCVCVCVCVCVYVCVCVCVCVHVHKHAYFAGCRYHAVGGSWGGWDREGDRALGAPLCQACLLLTSFSHLLSGLH